MKDDIKWVNPGHKQRRYTLEMSDDLRLFKKSTTRLHKTLEIELRCLQHAKDLKLTKIQQLVEGSIDFSGESYIISKYCGRNITRSKVPDDWREQLDIIDEELKVLTNEHKVYNNDVQTRNLFIDKSGQFTLIDFDLATIGKPNRRAIKRPGFNNCDYIRDKFINSWHVK